MLGSVSSRCKISSCRSYESTAQGRFAGRERDVREEGRGTASDGAGYRLHDICFSLAFSGFFLFLFSASEIYTFDFDGGGPEHDV